MYEFTHRLPHEPFRPGSRNEDEYFARLEIERRMELARQRRSRREREEQERRRRLHHDHCPECGGALEHARVREGEVRQCAACRGVWMDSDLFARLTHPAGEDRGYLANLLSGLLLDHTLGRLAQAPVAEEPPERT